MEDKKQSHFYITTAIHYANAGPHIGHAYEGVLADVIARYQRTQSSDVFFLSGTDEHGQKIVRGAEKDSLGPQAFVDKNAQKFQDLYTNLNLSNDDFIRTSDKDRHWPGAQKLWKIFEENDDIYKDTYRGLYCVGCERFMADRDLVDGKCSDHDVAPEEVEEENYFFRLSKYQSKVKELIESEKIVIQPKAEKEALLKLLEEPLEDVSFSRPEGTVPWGIPVPGDADQMMYVWCDALSNYISALGFGRADDENFEKFWPADVHVIGKDIVRFHAVYWPAMLLSAGISPFKTLLVHGHVTSEGKKMSKSLGNVVNPNEYIDAYGSDAFRYYLSREISPVHDGDFTKDKFIESYNGNLANGIGNLVSRTLAMANKYFDGNVTYDEDISVPLQEDIGVFSEKSVGMYHVPHYFEYVVYPEYQEAMESFAINKGADAAWAFAGVLDGYITDYEPFKLIKTDEAKARQVLWNALYGIWKLSSLIEPFVPDAAHKIREAVGAEDESKQTSFHATPLEKPLFQKINKED